MNCPHCSAALASHVVQCPHCSFSVASVRSFLGAEWVRLERLTDTANSLSLKEQRQSEIVLDEFERSFPQCFFAVYLGSLPVPLTARDLGFWLINHGAFHTQEIAKRNDYGIALVIDVHHQSASLTLGYALEGLIPEAALKQILNDLRRPLARRRYGLAIERAVAHFTQRLRQAGTRTLPAAPPGSNGPDLEEMGLRPLRTSHRPSRIGQGM